MKAKRVNALWILPLVAAPIAPSSAKARQASTTEWNADTETPGDWTEGIPMAGCLAGILNGGTVNFRAMGREN